MGQTGGLQIVRWRTLALPPGLPDLIDEAVALGVGWMADFAAEWRERPFTAEGEALFVAFEGDSPLGMAVISADPHVPDRETGRLRFIYVAPRARGRGLLRSFVEACLTRGEGRWRRLRLHTDNAAAARVYESYGFSPSTTENRSTHMRGNL